MNQSYHVRQFARDIVQKEALKLLPCPVAMPRRITVTAHLTPEELESRYRQAKDPVERTHDQIIWLLASGKRTEEVAAVTGYSRSWVDGVDELVWRYNRIGPQSLVRQL